MKRSKRSRPTKNTNDSVESDSNPGNAVSQCLPDDTANQAVLNWIIRRAGQSSGFWALQRGFLAGKIKQLLSMQQFDHKGRFSAS